jgi:predicted RNA-binding protein with RPS1 domain
VTAKIIKVDTAERKIGLSIKSYKKELERGEQDSYQGSQDKFDNTLGARIKEAEEKG